MKKLWVLTCFVCLTMCKHPIQPSSFAELYKKAYNIKSVSADSVFIWANQSLAYAQTPAQKYQAYYLIGYTAYQETWYQLAQNAYQNALQYAPDSLTKFDAINALASIHLHLGNYSEAHTKNQQCRSFFQQKELQVSLSYAYDLWGRILIKQQYHQGLAVLRQALELKQQYAPQQVGDSYISLTEAFVQLQQYDSAAIYQQKAIEHLPQETPNKTAFRKILLAKYLIQAGQPGLASHYLAETQTVPKKHLTELAWCHTKGLWLYAQKRPKVALQTFAHCDSLFQAILRQTEQVADRRAYNLQAVDMYQDILNIPNLDSATYQKYLGKKNTAQAYVEGYAHQYSAKDQLYSGQLAASILAFPTSKKSNLPWYILIAVLIVGIGLGWYYQQKLKLATSSAPASIPATHTELDLLIKRIELVCNKKLNEDEINIIRLRKAGVTYREIAAELQLKESTVRNKMHRLAKRGQRTSIERFF